MKFLFVIVLFVSLLNPIKSADNDSENIIRIANRIWATVGVAYPEPEIIINEIKINPDSAHTMAAFNPSNNKIYIGTDFYRYCLQFGEEAFAIVLAHEIGHYFNAHKSFVSLSGYIMSEKENDFIETYYPEGDFSKFKELETQADLFAAFHCYSAGYDIRNTWHTILDSLGKIIKTSQDTYLSLDERKKIAGYAFEKIQQMRPLYESAKMMLITGNYLKAAEYFDYIAENALSGWDIIANAGIAYAFAALDNAPQKDSLLLPFLIYDNMIMHQSTALRNNSGRNTKDYYENMYNKSIIRFSHLINVIPDFSASYFALASLNYYAGNIRIARNYAIKAEEVANNKYEKELAQILKAIIFSKNNKNTALKELNKTKNNPVTEYNIAVLNIEADKQLKINIPSVRANENINGIDITNYKFNYEKYRIDSVFYKELDDLSVVTISNKDFSGKIIKDSENEHFIIRTKPAYSKSTLNGIRINDNTEKVLNNYGKPDRILYSQNEKYLIYYNRHIAFITLNDTVTSWFIFSD
jgi:hypothetical protein